MERSGDPNARSRLQTREIGPQRAFVGMSGKHPLLVKSVRSIFPFKNYRMPPDRLEKSVPLR